MLRIHRGADGLAVYLVFWRSVLCVVKTCRPPVAALPILSPAYPAALISRRHLTESQRASIAARLANMRHGQRADYASDRAANLPLCDVYEAPPAAFVTQFEAASLLNVSERSVRTARKVQEHGAPELVAAVDSGMASVSAAAEIAQVPHDQQREIVAKGEKEILAAAKAIRAEKAVISRARVKSGLAITRRGGAVSENKNPQRFDPGGGGASAPHRPPVRPDRHDRQTSRPVPQRLPWRF
jgi:hypothetical protein